MSKEEGKTLVQILAEELKEWPHERAAYCVQDGDGTYDVKFGERGVPAIANSGIWRLENGADWGCDTCSLRFPIKPLADDYSTAIVTREQWEAERAKLRKPKANAQGWIRHRGGKCPVNRGVLVDVRFRDGEIAENCKALTRKSGHYDRLAIDWSHARVPHDIMAYRIRHPKKTDQPSDAVVECQSEVTTQSGGPLQWRSRINEIDRTAESLEKERASLVQRLADEGLQLISKKADKGESLPDMDDWRNWQVGDKVEILHSDNCGWKSRKGMVGTVVRFENEEPVIGFNGESDWHANDNCTFKFHSRPSK